MAHSWQENPNSISFPKVCAPTLPSCNLRKQRVHGKQLAQYHKRLHASQFLFFTFDTEACHNAHAQAQQSSHLESVDSVAFIPYYHNHESTIQTCPGLL